MMKDSVTTSKKRRFVANKESSKIQDRKKLKESARYFLNMKIFLALCSTADSLESKNLWLSARYLSNIIIFIALCYQEGIISNFKWITYWKLQKVCFKNITVESLLYLQSIQYADLTPTYRHYYCNVMFASVN